LIKRNANKKEEKKNRMEINLATLPVWVINLPTCTARLERMRRRLEAYGIPFTVSVASLPGQEVGAFDPTCRPTERACAYSHIRLWQKMVAEGIPAALILEDDIVFRHDWKAVTQAKLRSLHTEDPLWDALFLNSWNSHTQQERWHVCKDQWMAGAYILRLHAASWLLKSFSAQFSRSDSMTIALQAREHSYFYYPWLAIQEGSESYNGNKSGAVFLSVVRSLQDSSYGLQNYDFLPPLVEKDEALATSVVTDITVHGKSDRTTRNSIAVLTYCSGYVFEIYDRFAGTLYDTGYGGTLYFIVSSSELDISRRILQKYPKCKFWVQEESGPTAMHVNCRRFFLYQALLAATRIEEDMIFLCDSRDVLFQRNMETYPLETDGDLYVFQEGCRFKEELRFNVPWMRHIEALTGDNTILRRVWDLPVLCCGTTLGTVAAVTRYVHSMCDMITKYSIVSNLDQGIHNYFAYCAGETALAGVAVKFLSNDDELVSTVGFIAEEQTKSEKKGLYLNEKQQIVSTRAGGKIDAVPYVVHQYDRFPLHLREQMSRHKYNFVC